MTFERNVLAGGALSSCSSGLGFLSRSVLVPIRAAIYVVNSATRRTAQTPETGLAPGSLCDINVTGLYQPTGTLSQGDTVTLRFRAPGAADVRDMTILVTQPSSGTPTDFTALIPSETPIGQAEILAVAANGATFSAAVWIAASDFGIFTKTGAGYDAAAAQVWRGAPVTVGLTTPVQAGEWVTLWGTGLGSAQASGISVEVAGVDVSPSYAGAAPSLPGVDQINFQFPAGVPDDCYIPIVVKAGGLTGNTPSIAAASSPGPCHHRLGLSPDALATLDQGGRAPLSESWVHSDVLPTPDNPALYNRDDTVSLNFVQYDAAGVQVITGILNTPVAGCQLSAGSAAAGVFLNVPPLDAGTPVVIGPGGVRLTMSGSGGIYSTAPSATAYALNAIPPSSFVPGDWSVQVSGGKDVAVFQAGLRIPPALRWTNRAMISPVSRSGDLILNWDPTGYTDQEWMQGSIGVGTAAVICQAPATAGSITIPASLISELPATPTTATGTPMVELLLAPTNSNPQLYTVPLVGGGSFPGIATFSYLEMVWVELR
jgi:uncharacterized protein (TIGR03437 family)